MNRHNAPLSPESIVESDWSYSLADIRPQGGPYALNFSTRVQPLSSPDFGGRARESAGDMNGGYSAGLGSRSVGGPSPPPSIGRSSIATQLYSRSESGRSFREDGGPNQEVVLGEHYVALKRFLSATSRDGKPNPPPNKARDKLQRLTGVQFLELSTDVYDELKRREVSARPPPYLLPEDTFHPKRNQARQKLSSLGPPRFRDLVTDVFCELEKRYPNFIAGDIPRLDSPVQSMRGRPSPPSRSGTPVNSMPPPRGQSRRRPSAASPIRNVRSGSGINSINGYGVPSSPGFPPDDYERPMPKQFQSNTIVPNKSTMVEEDDDYSPVKPEAGDIGRLGVETLLLDDKNRKTLRNGTTEQSETDKNLIDGYESQVGELREKLNKMEEALKQKDDDLMQALEGERSKASADSTEKQKWNRTGLDLERRLAEALNLNDSLQKELERIRVKHALETQQLKDEHARETDQLRRQIKEARQTTDQNAPFARPGDSQLERDDQMLRQALQDQQRVTADTRREAQEVLREMRILSQQSTSAWERHSELERTIETLEAEVREWRSRYARTKTQLRTLRASSIGLSLDQDAAKYVREKGFTEEGGLVKDVHVTKFQIAVDELLRRARTEDPEKTVDSMKAVVVSVRSITKDIDESPRAADVVQAQNKLKTKVSATANNLITASKNFASAAGISPVSLLDAAVSHLVAAVVDLLRTVKIRSTPAGELDGEHSGTATPVDSGAPFSPLRSRGESQSILSSVPSTQVSTQGSVQPPPFQGLHGNRDSAESSAYSPISSPRGSYEKTDKPRNGMGSYMNGGNRDGYEQPLQNTQTRLLKEDLDDKTAVLVQTIQNLVQLIRGDAAIEELTDEIGAIVNIVGDIVLKIQSIGPRGASLVPRLSSCRQRLIEAGDRGRDLAIEAQGPASREWRMWLQTLPPIAFEIARESKELVLRVDQMPGGDGAAEFV